MHPRFVLDEEDLALGQLWQEWRPGMAGRGHLPFAGGSAEQPAIVMDALSVIEQAARLLEKKPERSE